MSNPIARRAALLSIGAGALACSGAQHPPGTSTEPPWLAALEEVVSFARAMEPPACAVIASMVPGAAIPCSVAEASIDILSDALGAYRTDQSHGALCALRAAADAALSARLSVTRLLGDAGVSAGVVTIVAGMLAFAVDALLPACAHPDAGHAMAMQTRAIWRLRAAVAAGVSSSGGATGADAGSDQ